MDHQYNYTCLAVDVRRKYIITNKIISDIRKLTAALASACLAFFSRALQMSRSSRRFSRSRLSFCKRRKESENKNMLQVANHPMFSMALCHSTEIPDYLKMKIFFMSQLELLGLRCLLHFTTIHSQCLCPGGCRFPHHTCFS